MKERNTPLDLINILADAQVHSGEQLGDKLGMTRAAINKHIKTLRSWGVNVQTVTGKGYKLPYPINLLNEDTIKQRVDDVNIIVEPVIDSTNQYMLERITELQSGIRVLLSIKVLGEAEEEGNGYHHLM